MLIEFSFANFRSFRDMQTFKMLAAPKRANDGGLDETNVFESDGIRLLKTKGIYGQNASGKSNFVRAFSVFKAMVSKSVTDEKIPKRIWHDRFKLLVNWDEEPMHFEVVYKHNQAIYRYGFQIKNAVVEAEWLYVSNGTGSGLKENNYFTRTKDKGLVTTKYFIGAEQMAELLTTGNHEVFRNDSLFLTGAALMGNTQAISVRDAIRSISLLDGVNDKILEDLTKNVLVSDNNVTKRAITELLKAAETGTSQLTLEDVPDSENNSNRDFLPLRKIKTTKQRFDEEGNIVDTISEDIGTWESAGTQKWLYTGVAILSTLVAGGIIIVDEFDARLHPNLTLKIVNLFNSPRTNPRNAQLIFATHDTGLLRRANLRRDQICFVDKDKYGVSSMKTLIEYKGVRKDESYEKEYLEGSYGAVAYLNDIDDIIVDFLKKSNEK